jgi:aminobenzoyl-glutamate transport protein
MSMKKKNLFLGPVIMILILILIICGASFIFDLLNISAEQTFIANGTLETSLVTVRNILSFDGLKFILSNSISNFQSLSPVFLIIIILLGIGICEKSGLFKHIFSPLKKLNTTFLIFLTLLVGILVSFIGEASYIILLPLTPIAYKYASKNAMLGTMVMFIGISLGYGFNITANYDDYMLGMLSESSASLEVDKNFRFSMFASAYILPIGMLVLSIFGTFIVKRFLVPNFNINQTYEEEEKEKNSKALKITNIAFIVLIGFIIYMIIPNLPKSGMLLDKTSTNYVASLFSSNAPFGNSLIFITSIIMMICGLIYGKISKNIKDTNEFSIGLGHSFDNLGYLFVLLFFFAQLKSILEWSNIGNILVINLTNLLSSLELSGIFLIIFFLIIVIISGLLIPSLITKWTIMSPIVIPLFMRANISPEFTQVIFRIGDAIAKTFTPFYVYLFIMIAFMQKYNTKQEKNITIFGTLKLMFKTSLIISLILILFILIWYLTGLPIGIKSFPIM